MSIFSAVADSAFTERLALRREWVRKSKDFRRGERNENDLGALLFVKYHCHASLR